MTEIQIHGDCDPRFEKVREAFNGNFENGAEVGAAVAVTLNNEPMVDLWAGHADAKKTWSWEKDTIVNVYSTTKGMTAVCAHKLVEQGLLDLDEKVATYWPEFAQEGKENIPVRFLMNHQAGLPTVNIPLQVESHYDWEFMTNALAAQKPWWTPGTAHGYHAITYGWLVGEVVKRISGKSLGTYFKEEVAEPLGLDTIIGLDDKDFERCADMIAAPPMPAGDGMFGNLSPDSLTAKVFMNPMAPIRHNSPEWRRAEVPAANGHTTARSLARMYGALASGGSVDGIRVLKPETIERARQEESSGPDKVLIMESRFGLGFMLAWPIMAEMFPNPKSFGHGGAGGSFGWADPETGIGFGYVMNQMQAGLAGDARAANIMKAVYASL